jgi:hypothetical protein
VRQHSDELRISYVSDPLNVIRLIKRYCDYQNYTDWMSGACAHRRICSLRHRAKGKGLFKIPRSRLENLLSSCLLSKNLKIKIYGIIILPVVCIGVKLGR